MRGCHRGRKRVTTLKPKSRAPSGLGRVAPPPPPPPAKSAPFLRVRPLAGESTRETESKSQFYAEAHPAPVPNMAPRAVEEAFEGADKPIDKYIC